ncbi:hypothetical protein K1719_016474 [Acacia pycnantha]|nr:hypothetical protein K1719_016474 [Acacia pycnantha]
MPNNHVYTLYSTVATPSSPPPTASTPPLPSPPSLSPPSTSPPPEYSASPPPPSQIGSIRPLLLVSQLLLPSNEPVVAMAKEAAGKTSGKRIRDVERRESLVIERDRRLKMNHMFAELQSTVPGLFYKVRIINNKLSVFGSSINACIILKSRFSSF